MKPGTDSEQGQSVGGHDGKAWGGAYPSISIMGLIITEPFVNYFIDYLIDF